MRCLIIHNPASGPSSDEIFAFTHALAQGGDEVVMRFIGDGMEPEDAVADVREFDRVVVSGGDGTVSNVLDQMRGCGVPTLVFPSGTACLFFNNIGNAPRRRRSPRPAVPVARSKSTWASSFGSTRTATRSATASSSSPARASTPRS
ncbi:diacylglycerol kinase family protein [Collinsella aerofaciens]|uniref:diacylglycerol kinase family protein n=1 Tax=Collinsella aerofaciens TaxID=74426 RepID=UPI0034A191FC